jgi:hypothetical protein
MITALSTYDSFKKITKAPRKVFRGITGNAKPILKVIGAFIENTLKPF